MHPAIGLWGGSQSRGAAMRMDIRSNVKDVERDLSDLARKQLPFALSRAINLTLRDMRDGAVRNLVDKLQNPTAFTRNAFALRWATKGHLVGTIYAKPVQAGYLARQEDGGERQPEGAAAILIPVGQRVNAHGNMPRGAARKAMARPDVFSGAPGGRAAGRGGIWQRIGKGKARTIRLLVAYEDRADYQPRLGFADDAQRTALAKLPDRLAEALAAALASRR